MCNNRFIRSYREMEDQVMWVYSHSSLSFIQYDEVSFLQKYSSTQQHTRLNKLNTNTHSVRKVQESGADPHWNAQPDLCHQFTQD